MKYLPSIVLAVVALGCLYLGLRLQNEAIRQIVNPENKPIRAPECWFDFESTKCNETWSPE